MKHLYLFLLFVTGYAGFCQTDTLTWTGASGNAWENPANWSPLSVPGPSAYVIIKGLASPTYPVLNGNTEIGYLDMRGGTSLDLNGHELETGTVWVEYASIYSDGGTLRTPMIRKCYGMNFYGDITIYADNGAQYGNTYHGDLLFYANPHVPTGATNCWPCGNMLFSYDHNGDVFKGRTTIVNNGMGSLGIGVLASGNPTVFEKPTIISSLNSHSTCLGINSYRGTTIFQDSVTFNFVEAGPNANAYLRSTIDFQGPVKFNQQGGRIAFVINEYKQGANIRVRKGFTVTSVSGELSLGGWDQGARSVMVFDSTASMHFENFTGGKVIFDNSVINIPHAELIAPTHPAAPVTGASVIFSNALINGSIHVKADDINLIGTTFNGRAVINKDGYAAQPNSEGGNTFNKPVELINSAGYDWTLGFKYSNVYRDSVRIAMSGTGKRQFLGSPLGASFKVGEYGSLFEGPVSIETGSVDSGAIHIESKGNTEFLSSVDISNFKSGELTFFNSKFRGQDLGRTMASTSPGVQLLLKDNCLFEGPVSFQVSHFGSNYTTFMKPVVIWKTGKGDDGSIGGNIFHQRVQFKNTASGGSIRFLSGEDKLIDKVIPQ